MALATNELFSSGDAQDPTPRVWPKQQAVKTIETDGAGATFAALTPLTYTDADDEWTIWVDEDTAKVDGFLVNETTLDDTGEVLAEVILECEIHVDDIPVPAGETESILLAALRTKATRDGGIFVKGLSASA